MTDEPPGPGPPPPGGDRPVAPTTGEADREVAAAADLADARRLTEELGDRLRRALADLDNLRKRYARELARERDAQRAEVTAAWLPVVDDLERALSYADTGAEALVAGVGTVRDQAHGILEKLGYPRFEDVGRPFDPARHEAVMTTAGDGVPSGHVVAAIRPGYGTEQDVLRPAAVVVAEGPA